MENKTKYICISCNSSLTEEEVSQLKPIHNNAKCAKCIRPKNNRMTRESFWMRNFVNPIEP